jgi:hypothetical protein
MNKRKEIVQMSNIVQTWKHEASPAGEIELTDAQLEAVYGSCDDEDRWPSWNRNPDREHEHEHVEFSKRVKFAFCFEEEIKKEEDRN